MLRELTTQRWRQQGELAFLLDGDLKEARGGLRDVRVLRGVAYAQVADAWRPPVRAAYTRLLDVRDALHLVAGRRRDRLFVQDLDDVAALLALAGPEALRRRIADDARTIAYAVDDSLRAAERWVAAQRHGGRRAGPAVRAPGRPRRGRPGRRGRARPGRGRPGGRSDAVAAGGRRGGPARPAHLARHAGVARPALPAAAPPVAARPRWPRSPSCSAPVRRWCPPGRHATGSA